MKNYNGSIENRYSKGSNLLLQKGEKSLSLTQQEALMSKIRGDRELDQKSIDAVQDELIGYLSTQIETRASEGINDNSCLSVIEELYNRGRQHKPQEHEKLKACLNNLNYTNSSTRLDGLLSPLSTSITVTGSVRLPGVGSTSTSSSSSASSSINSSSSPSYSSSSSVN